MDMCCTILVSLAVATLMQSQVMAGVFRDEDTNDASSLSMTVQYAEDSLQQIPVRMECPEGLNGSGVAESAKDAVSSSSSIMSGSVGSEGWRETASAALCRTCTSRMCTMCLAFETLMDRSLNT